MARGDITHIEFPADNIDRAKGFYEAVAGWTLSEMEGFPDYWMFSTGEGRGGAIGKRGVNTSTVIRTYINVPALEAAVAAAEAHGGKLVQPPTAIPGMGRYAAVLDSEGTEIGLWEDPAG